MSRYLFIPVALLIATGSMFAQGQELAPRPPIPRTAPDNSMWRVTTVWKNRATVDPTTGKSRPREMVRTIRKQGKLLQEEMVYGGEKLLSYIIGYLRLTNEGVNGAVVPISHSNDKYPLYGDVDFDNFRWVDMRYYKGVEEYKGRKVFVFTISAADKERDEQQQKEYKLRSLEGNALRAVISDSVAYLDVETQLPVAYVDASVEETYEFLSPPTTPIVIPAEFKAELVNRIDQIKAVN